MVKFTGFRIAAPSIRSFTLVCFSGLGLLACGKVLGVDFDVAPMPTPSPSKGGLTSVGGAPTVTAGDDGFRSSSTAIEPGGTEAGGGHGDGGDADAEVAVSAGGAPNSDSSTMGGSSGADASGGAAGGGGEIAEPARCDPRAPFTSVEKVHGISGAATLAHYSHNELTVYYGAPSDSGLSIVQATRPTIEDAFGAAEFVAPLNQLGFVASVSLTADGLTVYVENNATGGQPRIYSATRDAPDAEFPVPTMVSEIIAEVGVEGGPSISASGNDLYFHSTRNGNSELFRATRTAFGLQVVEELPVSSDDYLESFPLISPDDLTLYFLRRHVLSNSSNTTLWRSIRSNVSESFSDAEPISELDSPDVSLIEFADGVSTDNCRFYFSRMTADNAWSSAALYVATRAPEEP